MRRVRLNFRLPYRKTGETCCRVARWMPCPDSPRELRKEPATQIQRKGHAVPNLSPVVICHDLVDQCIVDVTRYRISECERGDLNPHGFPHWILSPARLPIPPLSQRWPKYNFGHSQGPVNAPFPACSAAGTADARKADCRSIWRVFSPACCCYHDPQRRTRNDGPFCVGFFVR